MVFHGVVGSTGEQPGNGGPPVPESGMGSQNGLVLSLRKGSVLDVRAQLIAPSEPARLTRPTLYVPAYQGPVSGSVALDEPGQDPVLFRAPRTLDAFRLVGISGKRRL